MSKANGTVDVSDSGSCGSSDDDDNSESDEESTEDACHMELNVSLTDETEPVKPGGKRNNRSGRSSGRGRGRGRSGKREDLTMDGGETSLAAAKNREDPEGESLDAVRAKRQPRAGRSGRGERSGRGGRGRGRRSKSTDSETASKRSRRNKDQPSDSGNKLPLNEEINRLINTVLGTPVGDQAGKEDAAVVSSFVPKDTDTLDETETAELDAIENGRGDRLLKPAFLAFDRLLQAFDAEVPPSIEELRTLTLSAVRNASNACDAVSAESIAAAQHANELCTATNNRLLYVVKCMRDMQMQGRTDDARRLHRSFVLVSDAEKMLTALCPHACFADTGIFAHPHTSVT